MRIKGLGCIAAVVALATSTACINTVQNAEGLELYVGLGMAPELTYALEAGSPAWLEHPAALAVEHWAQSLGGAPLSFSADPTTANVVIAFEVVSALEDQPAHTQLWGCRNGGGANCRIVVRMPVNPESMLDARSAVVFERGAFDLLLTDSKRYIETADYLRDKLALLIIAHEIGHTLGLGHSVDPSCLMAAAPGGGGALCDAEKRAARSQLATAQQ